MPLPAVVLRFAPPATVVAVPAAVNTPGVRTVAVDVRSTRKSAGSVAVADVPMASNVCTYGEPVGMETAAERTTARTATTAHTTSARKDLERIKLRPQLFRVKF